MLNGVSRMALGLMAMALFAVGSSWLVWLETNSRLERELELVKGRFEVMALEHQAALTAAEEARQARDEIHAMARARAEDMEQALESCGDFALMPLPDGLRLCLTGAAPQDAAAPGQSPGADAAAPPRRGANGGGHGAPPVRR